MKEYIAQPNYEHELTELTEPGKLCGPPGPDRAKARSLTYPGIAEAMAEQWASR